MLFSSRKRRLGIPAILIVGLLLVTAFTVFGGSKPASAANAALFNPGYIISDGEFYNPNGMTEAEIQSFINSAAPGACGPNGCLKQLVMDTWNKPQYYSDSSGRVECTAYPGAGGESAARIIFKVQQACGINAKALLVTMQKERGLVTKTHPISDDFTVAMGYGCPDTAACDRDFYGFFNQLWAAARQFKVYRAAPEYFNFRAGVTRNIQWHPNAGCGSAAVYIANAATAGLYNYTPYQPNAAALGNLYGTGDGCSSYGNRNFWAFYSDWFGSPIGQVNPVGNLDEASSPTPEQLRVRGWTFDYDTQSSIEVHVYVDGAFSAGSSANVPRRDVNAAYPSQTGNHGFEMTFAAKPGTRSVCVYALNVSYGQNSLLGCRTVVVSKMPPPEPAATEVAAVYRFWSDQYNGHFYTRSVAERDKLITQYADTVWRYEGVVFGAHGAQVEGTVPLYRFWSATYNGHFYTTSESEKNHVISTYPDHIWQYETVAFYVYPNSTGESETTPMARFWSPTYQHHFYTASPSEAAYVKSNYPPSIWTYESDFFRVSSARPSAAPLP